jgi:hypothetical protein
MKIIKQRTSRVTLQYNTNNNRQMRTNNKMSNMKNRTFKDPAKRFKLLKRTKKPLKVHITVFKVNI